LKVARTCHLTARTAVAEGQHPLSPKQKIKADAAARTKAALHAEQNSFRAVAWNWYNSKAPHRSDSWRDLNRRYLERDLIKAFGDMPIEAVTVDDLREALNTVATASPKNAERVRQVAGQVFQYAIIHNLGPKHNFARELAGLHEAPRAINNPKLTAPQLPDFFATLENYAGNLETRIAIKLLLLTMVRKSELLEANWSEIDFENALWRIPATRMKMDSSHTVPLSSQALVLFRQLKDLRVREDALRLATKDTRTERTFFPAPADHYSCVNVRINCGTEVGIEAADIDANNDRLRLSSTFFCFSDRRIPPPELLVQVSRHLFARFLRAAPAFSGDFAQRVLPKLEDSAMVCATNFMEKCQQPRSKAVAADGINDVCQDPQIQYGERLSW
jgi:integrase